MTRTRTRAPGMRAALALALALAPAAVTGAEASCRAIEAELASLGRGDSSAAYARAATVERQRAQRLAQEMAALGCERGSWLQPAAPACGQLRAQRDQHLAHAAGYEGLRGAGGTALRRQQLLAMLEAQGCRQAARPAPPPPTPRGPLTAGLYDGLLGRVPRPSSLEIRPDEPIDRPEIIFRQREPALAGKPVCVRLCDGFFFPLEARPSQIREEGDGLCAALCPGTAARLFLMPGDDIAAAVTPAGERYTALPTALRYRRHVDPACDCRREGEDWGEALRGATRHNPAQDDDTVIPSPRRPQVLQPSLGLRGLGPPVPPPPPDARPQAEQVVGANEGERIEAPGRDGIRRPVRIIAPGLSPAPSAAEVLPSPAPPRAP